MVGQRRDIHTAFTQCRQAYLHDVEPVIEILTKSALFHQSLQVPVRGCDQAHIDLNGLRGSQPFKRLALQHAQQFDLQPGRYIADLIDEQSAGVRHLEPALAEFFRAGKSAFLVTEHFAFQQLLRQSGHIDRHKRLVAPRSGQMDGFGHQLLARAAFPQNQHGRLAFSRTAGDAQALLHERTGGDDALERLLLLHQLTQTGVFRKQLLSFDRLGHDQLQLLQIDGFGQKIQRPLFHGCHRAFQTAKGGHDDHLDLGIDPLDFLQQLAAVHARHAQIGEQQIHRHPLDNLYRLLSQGRLLNLISFFRQKTCQRFPLGLFIIDDQKRMDGHFSIPAKVNGTARPRTRG
ncbi:MAG: hypothetical protein BWY83_02378 [bacterium ADurb.Bin478]|nr:MAG: hypothetical protein BWY83_02378 [bacterium ADurb.Bin478]